MAASARWSGEGTRFELTDDDRSIVVIDQLPPHGTGEGLTPTGLLLGALCACTGISLVGLLQKMRQPLRGLTVRAEGDRQADWPKAFTEIRLFYEIAGDGKFDDALVRKATQLATKRYCAVGGTIELGQGGCRIVHHYRIMS